MTNLDVTLRLKVPYQELKNRINVLPAEIQKKYGKKIDDAIENLKIYGCSYEPSLVTLRYYETCSMLYNIRVCENQLRKVLETGEGMVTNSMLPDETFKEILNVVNSYFVNGESARNDEKFDFVKDFCYI